MSQVRDSHLCFYLQHEHCIQLWLHNMTCHIVWKQHNFVYMTPRIITFDPYTPEDWTSFYLSPLKHHLLPHHRQQHLYLCCQHELNFDQCHNTKVSTYFAPCNPPQVLRGSSMYPHHKDTEYTIIGETFKTQFSDKHVIKEVNIFTEWLQLVNLFEVRNVRVECMIALNPGLWIQVWTGRPGGDYAHTGTHQIWFSS